MNRLAGGGMTAIFQAYTYWSGTLFEAVIATLSPHEVTVYTCHDIHGSIREEKMRSRSAHRPVKYL